MSSDKKSKTVRVFGSDSVEATERAREWVTFFRRNLEIFVVDWLDIPLKPFQMDIVHEVGRSNFNMINASRGIGKSFITALIACCVAILYPNSLVVITATTKDQGGVILKKIRDELRDISPMLKMEILSIKINSTSNEVVFHNGSRINVYPPLESSRGNRAHFIIFEEYRQVSENDMRSIFFPMSIPRQPPFVSMKKYEGKQAYIEKPKQVWISSAGLKSEYMWTKTLQHTKQWLGGSSYSFFAFDYQLGIYHGLKTIEEIEASRLDDGDYNFLIEYGNIMYGETSGSYFNLNQFKNVSNIKVPFYPKHIRAILTNPDKYSYQEKENNMYGDEIRVISGDIASGGGENDNNSLWAIRGVPYNGIYKREFLYGEVFNGISVQELAVNIKRLFYDFSADYAVLDMRNIGAFLYDLLAVETRDEEYNTTYPAWTMIEDDRVLMNQKKVVDNYRRDRRYVANAIPVIYPVFATNEINHDIAINFNQSLNSRKIRLLQDSTQARTRLSLDEEMGDDNNFLYPYAETESLIAESTQLEKSFRSGFLHLQKPSSGHKDRYSSASYGNMFITIKERDMIRHENEYDISALKGMNTRSKRKINNMKDKFR